MRLALFDFGLGTELATRVALDPRADDGHRMILLGQRCVTIKRRLRGVKMHLSVPVENYLGVVMAHEGRPDGAIYRVSLAHRDPDLSVTLKESRSRAAMIEAWQDWSAYFAAPASGDRSAGTESPIEPVVTRTQRQVKAVSKRRRCVAASHKARRMARPATVHRGERELTRTE